MSEWIITSSILIVIVVSVRFLFKNRLSARLRYGLWLLVLVRLLLPVSLVDSQLSILNFLPFSLNENQTATYGNLNGTPFEDTDFALGQDLTLEQDNALKTDNFSGQDLIEQDVISGQNANATSANQNIRSGRGANPFFNFLKENITALERTATAVLIGGMFLFMIILAVSNLFFYFKLRRSRIPFETEGNPDGIPVYISAVINIPCMFGLFRPSIYISPSDKADKQYLQYILQHEGTHYRHRDYVWSLLRCLCLILHWYNPFVWLAAYLSRQDAELACDESVTKNYTDSKREEYGRVLIELSAKTSSHKNYFCCATTMSDGKKLLRERIVRIAKKPQFFWLSTSCAVILCIAAILLTFTGVKEKSQAESTLQTSSSSQTGLLPTKQPLQTEAPVQTDASEDNSSVDNTPESSETEFEEDIVFINDFLLDLNKDGMSDILRLTGLGITTPEDNLTTADGLREWIGSNAAGYMILSVYDGTKAVEDMTAFTPGMVLDESSLIEQFDNLALAHPGNNQYSYYEADGYSYLIQNIPYFGQGYGSYSYNIWTYSVDWEKIYVAREEIFFNANPRDILDESRTMYAGYYVLDFPVEDMIAYTEKLKSFLDKAFLIADFSNYQLNREFTVSTIYDTENIVPNAYYIWNWDSCFTGVKDSEDLAEKLFAIKNRIYEAVVSDTEHDIDYIVTGQGLNAPDIPYTTAEEEASLSDIDFSKLPASANDLPYYIVEFAYANLEENIANNSVYSDWRIYEMNWVYTYYINENPIDIYTCYYEFYTQYPELIELIGGKEDKGDGWFRDSATSLGTCVAYDRNTGICFHTGSTDTMPGDYNGFVNDLMLQLNSMGLVEITVY